MKAVILHLKLLQPLLVARPGAGEENASEAFAFIPGSVIRGALIGRHLELNPGDDIARAKPGETGRPFFDGSACFLNGYPLARDGQRMLPIPLSWRAEKNPLGGAIETVYDFAVKVKDTMDTPVALSEGFAWTDGNIAELKRPERFLMVHNASESRGVKKAGQSFVYRYETLAEGQEFDAVIAGPGSHILVEALKLSAGMRLRLGGSRSANYGGTLLTGVQFEEAWDEAPGRPVPGGRIILTLLSDAILTGADGQPGLDLGSVLGAPTIDQYVRTRLEGGFNRKWGLPLPQAMALQAGSVFVYESGTVSVERLAQIAQEGIGERRTEGFGRVAVNWQGNEFCNLLKPENKPTAGQVSADAPALQLAASRQMAEKMAERRMRALLDRKLADALMKLEIKDPPQSSQLSRLRFAVRLALQENDLGIIKTHLDNLKSAKDQLERARVAKRKAEDNPERLNAWLEEHVIQREVDEGTKKWTLWSEYLKIEEPVEMAGIKVSETRMRDLEVEYTARLLDALFRRTTRDIQHESTGSGGENGSSVE